MRIFYILITIILVTTTQAKSQARLPIPEAEEKIVKFYPNPAVSYITFELDKDLNNNTNKSYSLQIYNFLGRKVYEVAVVNPRTGEAYTDIVTVRTAGDPHLQTHVAVPHCVLVNAAGQFNPVAGEPFVEASDVLTQRLTTIGAARRIKIDTARRPTPLKDGKPPSVIGL